MLGVAAMKPDKPIMDAIATHQYEDGTCEIFEGERLLLRYRLPPGEVITRDLTERLMDAICKDGLAAQEALALALQGGWRHAVNAPYQVND
jgi:hypothetical protein